METETAEDAKFANGDARVADRMSLFVSATLTLETGESMPVTVRNISRTGVMAQVPIELTRTQAVSISLAGLGSLDANIVWQAGPRTGFALNRPVDPQAVRRTTSNRTLKWPPRPGTHGLLD